MRRYAVGSAVSVAVLLLATSCLGDGGQSLADSHSTSPPGTQSPAEAPATEAQITVEQTEEPITPRVLDFNHLGRKSTDCSTCHHLPPVDHTAAVSWECAACHGGNGACDPNGEQVEREHLVSDDCVQCHQAMHGFEQPQACTWCHFATAGMEDCGEADQVSMIAGLTPASQLQSGCLNWPEQDFSASNMAELMLGLAEGEAAVEFALQDAAGITRTLSGLLRSKPVLLVLGGYT